MEYLVGLHLIVIAQNVGHRTPCRPEIQAKVGETSRLAPSNKVSVEQSECSTVKCGATEDLLLLIETLYPGNGLFDVREISRIFGAGDTNVSFDYRGHQVIRPQHGVRFS